jgi:hypothetical protein
MKDGVTYHKEYNKWRVCVLSAHTIYIGYCTSEESAIATYESLHQEEVCKSVI